MFFFGSATSPSPALICLILVRPLTCFSFPLGHLSSWKPLSFQISRFHAILLRCRCCFCLVEVLHFPPIPFRPTGVRPSTLVFSRRPPPFDFDVTFTFPARFIGFSVSPPIYPSLQNVPKFPGHFCPPVLFPSPPSQRCPLFFFPRSYPCSFPVGGLRPQSPSPFFSFVCSVHSAIE